MISFNNSVSKIKICINYLEDINCIQKATSFCQDCNADICLNCFDYYHKSHLVNDNDNSLGNSNCKNRNSNISEESNKKKTNLAQSTLSKIKIQ